MGGAVKGLLQTGHEFANPAAKFLGAPDPIGDAIAGTGGEQQKKDPKKRMQALAAQPPKASLLGKIE